MKDFRNKKIAVLGFGMEGLSSAAFLVKKGASVWVLDKKKKEEFDQRFISAAKALGVNFELGDEYLSGLSDFEMIVRSPGIKRNVPELLNAEKKGAVVTSQTKIFFDLCPCPIIAVTGTKGKGTTATMISEMLKAGGRDVRLGGNVGIPPLTFLEELKSDSMVVLELSSFQLLDLHKSPHIAVMLMVTSEHLDYHRDIEEYVSAKRNILRFQTSSDFAILNRDYPATNESDIHTEAKLYFVSREREVDEGCFKREDGIWLRMDGGEKKIINVKDILLPGAHNLENVCSAVMAATLAGITQEKIVDVLKNFKGLEHRLELVSEIKGVKYYDDSFSTTPETAIAAIQAFKQPEILILGGSSKNSDFSELATVINNAENIRALIGIGEEWARIKDELKAKSLESRFLLVEGAKDMHTIVQAAVKLAQPGDVVLLSPACASFDMFKNYKERGELFKKEVKELSAKPQ